MEEIKLSTRFIYGAIGAILLAIGLNVTVAVDLGVSMFDTSTLAIQYLLNMELLGNAALVLHAIFVILIIIFRSKLDIRWIELGIAILSVFILTRIINVFAFVAQTITLTSFATTVVYFVLSVLVFNIGVFFMAKSNLFVTPYDRFILQLSWLLNKEYGTTRLICDVALFATTILVILIFKLPVPISIGTLYIIFTSGLQINLISKIFNKLFNI
ncbi:DUF6198 family protein [Mollicutes bacterium LVI A0039]|nr:DUF6198 family protein [Mollicutes bacterium LVI A0039]